MDAFIILLFGWMPLPLQLICAGSVSLFFLFTLLHIVRFIFDLIPFL